MRVQSHAVRFILRTIVSTKIEKSYAIRLSISVFAAQKFIAFVYFKIKFLIVFILILFNTPIWSAFCSSRFDSINKIFTNWTNMQHNVWCWFLIINRNVSHHSSKMFRDMTKEHKWERVGGRCGGLEEEHSSCFVSTARKKRRRNEKKNLKKQKTNTHRSG